MKTNQKLIDKMITSGVLKTPSIIKAFQKIDRKLFVPEIFSSDIYIDVPLPIGRNQTISQPSTVAFMLELLEAKEGDEVLDIGSGSGWTTSLLCNIVGEKGSVTGLERFDELIEIGQKNLAQFHADNCHIQKAAKILGIPNKTFDAILVSASADEIPKELFSQMKIGATLVIPVKNSIFKFKKISEKEIKKEEYYGFVFVPLIYENCPI